MAEYTRKSVEQIIRESDIPIPDVNIGKLEVDIIGFLLTHAEELYLLKKYFQEVLGL